MGWHHSAIVESDITGLLAKAPASLSFNMQRHWPFPWSAELRTGEQAAEHQRVDH